MRRTTVAVKVHAIMLGVEDLERSKRFYAEGLGCKIASDYGVFVSLDLGDGSSSIALYPWAAAAEDAGVAAAGQGFRGVSLHYLVDARDDVDAVIGQAAAAGGAIVRKPEAAPWGGYFGYFSDPDGHLWKVATSG
jgi:uncharacterized protein